MLRYHEFSRLLKEYKYSIIKSYQMEISDRWFWIGNLFQWNDKSDAERVATSEMVGSRMLHWKFIFNQKWCVRLFPLDWSTLSFSWSFGVTLFEMYSLGQLPYQNVQTSELLKFLQDGNRLSQPELCPEKMSYSISFIFLIVVFRYEVMRQCWCLNSDDRPTFDEVRRT